MATIRLSRPSGRYVAVAGWVANAFWILAAAAVVLYGFFVALGAFSPGDVAGVSIGVALLALLWALHAWSQSHRGQKGIDRDLVRARERRGF
jgi:hypothetical protein